MSLQRTTRSKINDWVTWWNWHSDKVDNYPIEQKVKWMMKAMQGAYDIMTELAREQDRNGGGERRIAIPTSWRFDRSK